MAFNPDFDPFVASNCWVTKDAHVSVDRSVSDGRQGQDVRFTKKFLRSVAKDYSWFNTHECELLMSFKSLHLSRVVQVGALHWDGPNTFDRVETLDAGPSLMHWLHLSQESPNVHSTAHPLATPAAFLLLVRGLMLALHEVHGSGFVHCDLREANVCLAFIKHPTQTGVFTPNWHGLKLIDFAFSLSKEHPLREHLPIAPAAHLHSAAFMDALEADNCSGQPRRVSKLDWRIDMFALGAMIQRLYEDLRPKWSTGNDNQVAATETIAKNLIAKLKAMDFSETSRPDLLTHGRLLQPVDNLLKEMGPAPTPAFITKPHVQPSVPTLASAGVARPTPMITNSAAPTPMVPPNLRGNSPPSIAHDYAPAHAIAPGASSQFLVQPVRVMLPAPPNLGAWSKLWHKLSDSMVLERYRAGAAKGNARAAYKVGNVILRGYAAKQDPAMALQWLLVAAKQGHDAAQAMAGTMYDCGYGTVRDDALAAHWYVQAASQGNATGHYGLGVLLSQGRSLAKDDIAAVTHLRTAAAAGLPAAYSALGQLILAGRGVVRNRDDALECFRRAADLGDGTCAHRLGRLYEQPEAGSLPNPVESLRWYRRAVKLGCAEATSDVQRMAQLFPQ